MFKLLLRRWKYPWDTLGRQTTEVKKWNNSSSFHSTNICKTKRVCINFDQPSLFNGEFKAEINLPRLNSGKQIVFWGEQDVISNLDFILFIGYGGFEHYNYYTDPEYKGIILSVTQCPVFVAFASRKRAG